MIVVDETRKSIRTLSQGFDITNPFPSGAAYLLYYHESARIVCEYTDDINLRVHTAM